MFCTGKKSRCRAASEGSDCWRKMIKDCVTVKRSDNWPKELDKLMAAVDESASSSTPVLSGDSATADLEDAAGADDVEAMMSHH